MLFQFKLLRKLVTYFQIFTLLSTASASKIRCAFPLAIPQIDLMYYTAKLKGTLYRLFYLMNKNI